MMSRKKKTRLPDRPHWEWRDGWRSAAWAVICVEGVLAGGDRPCMPSFDLSILFGQMMLMHALGVAELLGLCAAIPAFIAAAVPKLPTWVPSARATVMIALGIATLALQLFLDNPALWVPIMGLAIGLLIRWYDWARSYWLVLALLTATAFGVIQFSGREYGLNNCWP